MARYNEHENKIRAGLAVTYNEHPAVFKQLVRVALADVKREIMHEYKRELHKVDERAPELGLARRYAASRSFRLGRRVRWFGRHAAFTSFRTAR